ncbi:MAG: 3-keto-disaccharide hydrolase [Vicinamibacterales bacterium]
MTALLVCPLLTAEGQKGQASRVVEIRSYNLKPGTHDRFHELVEREALPMLRRWKVDVVSYGPSLHDSDSYYLMRSFSSPEDRQRSEDAFYGSDEWRKGPREAILACIESYTTVVVQLDEPTLDGLRKTARLDADSPMQSAAVQPASPVPSAVVPDRVTPLFNGRDLTGWKADVPAKDTKPDAPDSFIVRNGLLVSLGEPRGHLLTEGSYRDYRLEVEYRFPGKGGNCGVLMHASRLRALNGMFPQSIEVQMAHQNAGDFWCIEENIQVPEMEKRRPRQEGQKWGGSAGDARRILNLTDDSEKPLGEWNTMVIEARGRTIKVWVNGDLVNDGSLSTADRGRIALQAEGTEVEFRRVDIGPLPPSGK